MHSKLFVSLRFGTFVTHRNELIFRIDVLQEIPCYSLTSSSSEPTMSLAATVTARSLTGHEKGFHLKLSTSTNLYGAIVHVRKMP